MAFHLGESERDKGCPQDSKVYCAVVVGHVKIDEVIPFLAGTLVNNRALSISADYLAVRGELLLG